MNMPRLWPEDEMEDQLDPVEWTEWYDSTIDPQEEPTDLEALILPLDIGEERFDGL